MTEEQLRAYRAWETRRRRKQEEASSKTDRKAPRMPQEEDPPQSRTVTRAEVRRDLEKFGRLLREVRQRTVPRAEDGTAALRKGVQGESIVLFLSDLHFGKLILAENEPGRILFDKTVGRTRIRKLMDATLQEAHSRKADEIVVLMGGDLIDGEGIYPTQAMHIQESVLEQVKGTAATFLMELRRLSAISGLPIRVVGCSGNHGRISKEADELSNWDQAIYVMLDLLCAEIPEDIRVSYPSTRQFVTTMVQGHRVLLRHRAKRGTSPSPVSQWQSWIMQHDFAVAATGHWHAPAMECVMGRPIFRNGSLCGKDDYAESLGLGDEACQWIWGMGEKEPVTFARLVTFKEG